MQEHCPLAPTGNLISTVPSRLKELLDANWFMSRCVGWAMTVGEEWGSGGGWVGCRVVVVVVVGCGEILSNNKAVVDPWSPLAVF